MVQESTAEKNPLFFWEATEKKIAQFFSETINKTFFLSFTYAPSSPKRRSCEYIFYIFHTSPIVERSSGYDLRIHFKLLKSICTAGCDMYGVKMEEQSNMYSASSGALIYDGAGVNGRKKNPQFLLKTTDFFPHRFPKTAEQ